MAEIKGYGIPGTFDTSTENVVEQVADLGLGAFVKRYEIEGSSGGNALFSSGGLEGVMCEFELGFFVVWSCGEYIDWAVFRKQAA